VPSGGHLETSQTAWLTSELQAAATDRPLIVAVHHPPYSIDAMHGGSQLIGDALDGVFADSGRTPDLVLAGHVHNYQRFTRTIADKHVPYVVIGNSGYHNLHRLAPDAQPGQALTDDVTFEFGDDTHWGFLEITIQDDTITGSYTAITQDEQRTPNTDTFTTSGTATRA
jgi:hypothetical protein